MAAVKVQSLLAKKYGAKLGKAVEEHADDTTTYGIIKLPPGIANGIAQINKCYFKEFDKNTKAKKIDGSSAAGEIYFYAEGVVDSPKTVSSPEGTIPVFGLTTSMLVSLVESKDSKGVITTQEDQIERILNIMRMLMGPDYTKGATLDTLEALAKDIEDTKPHFRFSTTPRTAQQDGNGYKKGDVTGAFENWHGNRGLENYIPEDVLATAFNEELTKEVHNGVEKIKSETKAVVTKPEPLKKVTSPQKPEKRVDAITPVDEMDLDELVSLADSEADTKDQAQEALRDKALAAGYTEEEILGEETTWEEVKVMIENPKTSEEESNEEPEEVEVPKVKQTCIYAPNSKKNPGTKLPARDCSIIKVDEDKQTVDLKDLTQKINTEYKGVAWVDIS